MARVEGDKNLSLREKRKDAQIAVLKAAVATEKAKRQVALVRLKEVQAKLKAKSV